MPTVTCVGCGTKDKLALVLVHAEGSREWTKHRFLCQSCRDDPTTKGWWKYVSKRIQKDQKPLYACPKCGHDVKKFARGDGCVKPMTVQERLGWPDWCKGNHPCQCTYCCMSDEQRKAL